MPSFAKVIIIILQKYSDIHMYAKRRAAYQRNT